MSIKPFIMPEMSFNFIDALLLLVILSSAVFGWYRGFIFGLIDLARWIGSLLSAFYFYYPVSLFISRLTGWSDVWSQPLAFVFVIIAASGLIQFLANFLLLRRISPDVHEKTINRIFGVFPGLISGFIMAAILSALLFAAPFSDNFQESLRESATANQLAVYTEELETALVPIFDDAIGQTLNRLTIRPESSERVELPFRIENARPRPDLETEMLKLINQERAAAGLEPLEPDPELTEVARRHSADMFSRGYFSHNTPENKTPFDRIREADVRFRTAGENLALAPTLQIAHRGLMNSPGHRENILRPQFGRAGIGILDGGRRGLMVTQNFRN